MRRWIEGWHVGQLVLAWLALAVLWCVLGGVLWGGLAAMSDETDHVSWARESITRDSLLRANPVRLARVVDSTQRLRAAGSYTWDIEEFLRKEGFIPTRGEREWIGAAARRSAWRMTTLVALVGGVVALLPVGVYVMTWVWFGGRRRPPPRESEHAR